MKEIIKTCSECKHSVIRMNEANEMYCNRLVVCMIEGTKKLYKMCESERKYGECGLTGKYWEYRSKNRFIRVIKSIFLIDD